MAEIPSPSARFPALGFPQDTLMLYCIGAQKAGTTWLHRLLQTHPQCHVTRAKEVHYFDVLDGLTSLEQRQKRRMRDIQGALGRLNANMKPTDRSALILIDDALRHLAMYTALHDETESFDAYIGYLLNEWRSEKVICDITPSYSLLGTERFAQMAQLGNARFAFIMRDPVSRVWSQVRMSVRLDFERDGQELHDKAFAEACHKRARSFARSGADNLRRSSYVSTIDRLETKVERERVLYLFFEDLFKDVTVQKISDFLDLSNDFTQVSSKMNEGISVSIDPENARALREVLKEQYDGIFARFGDDLPEAWHKWDHV
ncbi:MAG: sulfotransferase [Pseudomonadota bacterium]